MRSLTLLLPLALGGLCSNTLSAVTITYAPQPLYLNYAAANTTTLGESVQDYSGLVYYSTSSFSDLRSVVLLDDRVSASSDLAGALTPSGFSFSSDMNFATAEPNLRQGYRALGGFTFDLQFNLTEAANFDMLASVVSDGAVDNQVEVSLQRSGSAGYVYQGSLGNLSGQLEPGFYIFHFRADSELNVPAEVPAFSARSLSGPSGNSKYAFSLNLGSVSVADGGGTLGLISVGSFLGGQT